MTQGERHTGVDSNYLKRNKELVDKALEDIVAPALKPFILRQMKKAYGKNWLQDARLGLEDYHFDGDDLKWADPQVVLKLILNQWNGAFREPPKFDRFEHSLISELLQVRNAVKHNEINQFDDDYTFRALDSMARLLKASSAKKEAQQIEQLKNDFRQKWRGDNQVEYQTQSESISQSVVGAESLRVNHQFKSLIEEKTKDFVGRKFVFNAIERFFSSQSNGYFIIEADPGVGKSAIIANYAQETGCIVHFNVRSQGINRADQFLDSVCTQIISRYNLPYPSLPADATRDGKFFANLLNEVSAKLKPGDQLIIAIDALDEVDQTDHAGGNILFLPATLPKKVFFLLTQRPITLALTVNTPLHRFDLMQYQAESSKDIQTYIKLATERSLQLKLWINQQGLTVEDFVKQLADKSENNFMYLRYVLTEIERGVYQDLSINSLPQGLQAYYEDHWRRMGMLTQPLQMHKIAIVYFLAELREPVSRRMLADLSEGNAVTVQQVINEWKEFLREVKVDEETRYSVYHQSFCDFLYRQDIIQAYGDDFSS